jgi:DNA mismatch repair protein MutL
VSRIRILSEQLANRIAAGEVVERPASVVKELMENSLDAGAGRIDIDVEGGGTTLLRVADDGCGMDEDDVLLSIERHATSKLHDETQLAAIATLGFRGEALPSIASVSWLTIVSRQQEAVAGVRAELRYGVLREIRAEGCAPGTVIEVRHLFGNMPARRKFLKSARTELAHIEEAVRGQALAHPAVGFVLRIDDRVVLDYAPGAELADRVREVFRYREELLDLDAPAGEAGEGEESARIGGFLLLPESAPSGRARLRILVNDRPVHDAMVRHAVLEGMRGFLMKGYEPAGLVVLRLEPDQVDVNVHPAKREVRFRQSEEVRRLIIERVRSAMARHQEQLRASIFALPDAKGRPGAAAVPEEGGAVDTVDAPSRTDHADAPLGASVCLEEHDELKTAEPLPLPGARPDGIIVDRSARPRAEIKAARSRSETGETAAPEQPAAMAGTEPEPERVFAGLTLIGQLFSLYLLCEQQGRLIVIDQHAAHERLLYGQMRQQYLAAPLPRQVLLLPVTVELSPTRQETLEQRADLVTALGLEVEPFGGATHVIKTVPASAGQVEPGALLNEVLDGLRGPLGDDAGLPVPRAVDELLASMACKAAIKAGNRLYPAEMLELLARMEASEVFSHCPHGRPVLKVFTAREVEQWFHRHGS